MTSLADFRDGVKLALLIEILVDAPVRHTPAPKTPSQYAENLGNCMDVLAAQGVRARGVTPEGNLLSLSIPSVDVSATMNEYV